MVLPVTPGLPLSASQIFNEFAIPASTTQRLSNDLFPRIEGTAGTNCSFSSFSGKSTLNRFTYLQQTAGNHGIAAVKVDASGNIIVCGYYSSGAATGIYNMTLPPTLSAYSLPAPTNYDMFLLKYNSAGTLIGYTTLNANNADQATELDIDSAGNIYITGEYSSTVATNIKTIALPPAATVYNLPASSSYDVYVIKWNSSGGLVSFTYFNASGTLDQGNSIRVDSSQNVYITGYYQGAATINTMSLTPASSGTSLPATAGGDDAFVIKWNSAGTLVSYTTIRGSGGDWGFGLDVDSSQNVYVAGYYNNTAGTIPINTMSLTPAASGTSLPATTGQDGFLIKWNSAGTLVSYTNIKGSGTDSGAKVAVDSSQNVYLSGWYSSTGTVPINTMSLTPAASTYVLPATTSQDAFVIKWNSSGSLVSFTYISGNGADYARGIKVDSSQNVYVVGSYISSTPVTINTMSLTPASSGKTLSATSSDDMFAIKWNSSGSLVSYTTISGTASDYATIIFVDSNQNVYFTCQYNSTGAVNINSMNLTPAVTGYTLPATPGGVQDGSVFKHGKTGV